MESQQVADKHGLGKLTFDCNGYGRTTDHFDYTTKSGYRSFSKNLTLLLERGELSTINSAPLAE